MKIRFSLAALLALACLLPGKADAACKPSDYGCADFSERRAFPQDGKCLDFGASANVPEGDLLNRSGDFESWDGSHANCSDCPTGELVCSCNGDSDLSPETSIVHSGNYSLKYTTDASSNTAQIVFNKVDLEPDSAYLFTFWTKGGTANDDMYVALQTSTEANRYYNDATDAWQAGSDSLAFNNMGVDWTKRYYYVLTDSAVRADSWFALSRNGASQTWYLDDVQLHKLPTTGPEFATRERMSYDVAGDPGIECKGAVGCYAVFDGSDDGFERADDGTFSPSDNTDSFSVGVRFKPKDTTQANQYIACKGVDWYVTTSSGDDMFLAWYDSTNTFDTVVVGNFLIQNAWNSAVTTYSFDGDAASDVFMRGNNEAEGTTATGEGPLRDNDYTLGVGYRADTNANYSNMDIGEVCYWNRALSAVERSQFNNPFFGKTNTGDGMYVTTCSQAANHAVCGDDGCVDWAPNSCWPDQRSMPVFGQYTIENDNTDTAVWGASAPNGWTRAVTGTGSLSQYYGDSFSGESSVRLKGEAQGDISRMFSDCITAPAGSDTTVSSRIKLIGGVGKDVVKWIAVFYSGGACTTSAASVTGSFVTPGGGWSEEHLTVTAAQWGVYTGVKFQIWAEGTNGPFDLLVDAINITESSYPMPYANCPDGSGTCTVTARDLRVANPLAQESGGAAHYADGFCVGGWVYTDWAGNDGVNHYILTSPGTSGNNNRWIIYKDASNNFIFYVFASSGTGKLKGLYSVSSTQWSSGIWKYVESCTSNTGNLSARHLDSDDFSWYSWSSGGDVGTGIQDGAKDFIDIGAFGTSAPLDGYIDSFAICPYETPFPKCGWGQGPPQYTP